MLTGLTAAVAVGLLLRGRLDNVRLEVGVVTVGLAALLSLLPILSGYVCFFLNCVLAARLAGEARHAGWPVYNLEFNLRSLLSWLLSFACVPAPLGVIGFYYWLNCGDLQWVDWIILAEMGIVASGYWLLAVLAVCRSGCVRDANPWRVAQITHRLGWRSLIVVMVAGLLFLSHGLLAFYTASMLSNHLALGLLLAAGCWLGWLYWATFMFRLVGVWYYHRWMHESRT
jgi:hypothetical protein